MDHSLKTGLSFGVTSGVITTLGLLVGLHSGTHSRAVIMGGILTIAVADALSDALGIHVSEEAENKHGKREIWISTISTFLSKFIFAITFLLPVIFLPLPVAVPVSIAWGIALLTVFSYMLAKNQGERPLPVIGEHIFIAVLVILITHFLGDWISRHFA